VDAGDALEELAALVRAEPRLEVATVARSADGEVPDSRVLALADDAEAFFRGLVTGIVEHGVEQWELKTWHPLYKPDRDTVEWVAAQDVPAIEFARDRHTNLNPLAPFDAGDDAYKRRLRYWVCVLTGRDGRKAFFFRSFSRSAELERRRGVALVSRNGTFTKIEEHVFLFDEAVDCILFEGCLLVLRKLDYRRIFDQLEEVRQHARRAAQALHQRVPIANFEEFADACSRQAAMADKLLIVQKRPYFRRLTFEMLSGVIQEFRLDIPVRDVDGQPHLVFRTEPEHRWRILRLVDDDYLKSAMTDEMYEVNSKSDPPR
jgi:hypothetical protein